MEILNLGIFAHVDAGKTTTVERLLYESGTTRQLGSVDNGTAATDDLQVERERGISVKSASAVINLPGLRLNIIDTPGHIDFMAEVQRALLAIDIVLLIVSAAEGVQSQTELFFKAFSEMKLPLLIFVNKIDRVGVDVARTELELREKLSPSIFPVNQVSSQGDKNCSVSAGEWYESDIWNICDKDEDLGEAFLNGEALSREQLEGALFELCGKGEAYPLIYGSAARGVGIDMLLNTLLRVPRAKFDDEGTVSGKVYKIEHLKTLGKAAHIRLFSGSLKSRDNIKLLASVDDDEPRIEKVTQIRKLSSGTKVVDCNELTAGDIAVVFGLQSAKIGDIVGEVLSAHKYPSLKTVPLFNVKVSDGTANPKPLLTAMQELTDEDPLLSCEWAPEEREITVSMMGEIQIEVLRYLLLERYGIRAEFSSPTIIYRETVKEAGRGFEAYTMPKPCWAVVELGFEPLPLGAGYSYSSNVKGEQIPYKYQRHIERSLSETMKQGLYGWEVTDVKITLTGGGWHFIHTHPMDFFLATPIAFMNGMSNCGSQLLEPFLLVKIVAQEELSGKIIGDIIAMRGEFGSPSISGGNVYIEASLPLATSMDYPTRIASLSSGKARYSASFDGYRPCPFELGKTAKRRGVNPLDRAKWILYMRQAL